MFPEFLQKDKHGYVLVKRNAILYRMDHEAKY
jgi:hypothetical protein